jgi:hypothetical protein
VTLNGVNDYENTSRHTNLRGRDLYMEHSSVTNGKNKKANGGKVDNKRGAKKGKPTTAAKNVKAATENGKRGKKDVVALPPSDGEEDDSKEEEKEDAIEPIMPISNKKDDSVDKLAKMFKVKVDEGMHLKILFGVIHNTMPGDVVLMIAREGVYYSMENEAKTLLLQFCFKASNRIDYVCPRELDEDDSMMISIPSTSMQKYTKARKDNVMKLYIMDTDRKNLHIDIKNKKTGSITPNEICIGKPPENYNPVDAPHYSESLRPTVSILGSEFVSKCKGLNTSGAETTLLVQAKAMRLEAGIVGQGNSKPSFGKKWDPAAPILFRGTYPSKMLAHLSQLGGLNKFINVYCVPGLPLRLSIEMDGTGPVWAHLYAPKGKNNN